MRQTPRRSEWQGNAWRPAWRPAWRQARQGTLQIRSRGQQKLTLAWAGPSTYTTPSPRQLFPVLAVPFPFPFSLFSSPLFPYSLSLFGRTVFLLLCLASGPAPACCSRLLLPLLPPSSTRPLPNPPTNSVIESSSSPCAACLLCPPSIPVDQAFILRARFNCTLLSYTPLFGMCLTLPNPALPLVPKAGLCHT